MLRVSAIAAMLAVLAEKMTPVSALRQIVGNSAYAHSEFGVDVDDLESKRTLFVLNASRCFLAASAMRTRY